MKSGSERLGGTPRNTSAPPVHIASTAYARSISIGIDQETKM